MKHQVPAVGFATLGFVVRLGSRLSWERVPVGPALAPGHTWVFSHSPKSHSHGFSCAPCDRLLLGPCENLRLRRVGDLRNSDVGAFEVSTLGLELISRF